MNDDATMLKSRVAVVTGGVRGLGRSIAQALANLGASIACVDLDSPAEAMPVIAENGGGMSFHCADLTDEEQTRTVFNEIIRAHGQIDLLVNNAGFYAVERRPFWELGLAEWEQVMTRNIRPAFLCSRAASRSMMDAGAGSIINISSNVITFGMAGLMHYAAAKSALIGMTRSMARELGDFGINVNAVAPGLVATDTARAAIGQEVLDDVVQGQVIRQPLTAEHIAAAVAYLCSPAAATVTGQTLLVNGGATMGSV